MTLFYVPDWLYVGYQREHATFASVDTNVITIHIGRLMIEASIPFTPTNESRHRPSPSSHDEGI